MDTRTSIGLLGALLSMDASQHIDRAFGRARLRNAYDGNPSGVSRDERAKRKKKAKIAKASRKRNRR